MNGEKNFVIKFLHPEGMYPKLNFCEVFYFGQVSSLGRVGHLALKNLGYDSVRITPAQTVPTMPVPFFVPVYYSWSGID